MFDTLPCKYAVLGDKDPPNIKSVQMISRFFYITSVGSVYFFDV
jgi:hypothetical protein